MNDGIGDATMRLTRFPNGCTQRLAFAAMSAACGAAFADEGMWPFSDPPLVQLKQAYGFEPDRAWFDHLRLASVRIRARRWPGSMADAGCFVGENGIVLTARHVVADILFWNWSWQVRFERDGFVASLRKDEIPCPGFEIEVLKSMEDVTAEVNGACSQGESSPDAMGARREAIDAILRREKRSDTQRSQVVSLHGGAEHWLYRFEKYDDVRLVFLPESFARSDSHVPANDHAFDAALLRVYRDGKPIAPDHWLQSNTSAVQEDDFVAAFGNPGHSSRSQSIPEIEFMRTIGLPLRLQLYDSLISTCAGSECDLPASKSLIDEFCADLKTWRDQIDGELERLNSPAGMAWLELTHKTIRDRLQSNPSKLADYDRAIHVLKVGFEAYSKYARRDFWCQVIADSIARARQPMFTPSESLMRMRDRLYCLHSSPTSLPYFRSLDRSARQSLAEALLASALEQALDSLGEDDPLMVAVLDGQSSAAIAKAICVGPHVRTSDPAWQMAKRVESMWKELQDRAETDLGTCFDEANACIASSYHRAFGSAWPPDANATPRLSYGRICGWANARDYMYWRSSYDSFLKGAEEDGVTIPARWRDAVGPADETLTSAFFTTCDALGGNSGGAVVDRNGRLRGIMTNSRCNQDVYDSSSSRSTALDINAILLVLRRVYGAGDLAAEIVGPEMGTGRGEGSCRK